MTRYRVLRSDRAAYGCPPVGTIVYPGNDAYGLAHDDTRHEGIDYTACSVSESGSPCFTIPEADIERLPPAHGDKP